MRECVGLLLVCLCLLGSGCFVFEELDKGREMMHKHSAASKNDAADKRAAEENGDAGFSLAALKKKGMGVLGELSGRVEEAFEPAPDPDNMVVGCKIDGRRQFTRKFDCQSRGGLVLPR